MRIKGRIFRIAIVRSQVVCKTIRGEMRIYFFSSRTGSTPHTSSVHLFLEDYDRKWQEHSDVCPMMFSDVVADSNLAPISSTTLSMEPIPFNDTEDQADAWISTERNVIYTSFKETALTLLWGLHNRIAEYTKSPRH